MKPITCYFSIIFSAFLLLVSCVDDNSYSKLLEDEKTTVADYLKRMQINVIKTLPAENATWGEKDYYLSPQGFYFHLVKRGENTSDSLKIGDTIYPRFIEYSLKQNDNTTTSTWTPSDLAYPVPFIYGLNSETAICFHYAAKYMKYNFSEAKLIVPSVAGLKNYDAFNSGQLIDNQSNAVPKAYDFKIQFQR